MKGVSDNSAQDNKQIKGLKKDSKKPIQVLRISKKDNISEKEFDFENQTSTLNNKIQTNPIKPELNEEKIENDKEAPINLDIPRENLNKPVNFSNDSEEFHLERKVDEFDFDESAFLEALNANEPIGSTGETISGKVIALESDGLYVDIGGKAPGFMPKNECGLGVITNFKEKFPVGLEMEVLVIKEQNADGMVTISSRALILRQS
tara:strand:- start:56 stop:673 length:618 start_codon:yes stop_codon:yes gene_type:complete